MHTLHMCSACVAPRQDMGLLVGDLVIAVQGTATRGMRIKPY